MLVDLTSLGITGKVAQVVLDNIGIVANRNMIPFDKEKPMVTSGLRLGTPCVTTRGMKEAQMDVIADLIVRCLKHTNDTSEDIAIREKIAQEVKELTSQFPVYD